MYELVRLDVRPQPSEQVKGFEALLPRVLHCCLEGKDPNDVSDTVIIAIGALDNSQPVGIALASCYRYSHHVKLHHIFVQPAYRGKHLGHQLLDRLQLEAKNEGGRYYTFEYKIETPETPALEKVLTDCGWNTGKPFIIECRYNSYTFDPPWIHTHYKFPDSMQVFPWVKLSDRERQQILYDARRGVIPIAVSPFLEEELIEPLNSLGLRSQGRVIGWVITHRTDPDTILYRSLYVERSFHFLGPGGKLLIDSMLIQKKHPIKWAVFELPLTQVRPAWIQFVQKRLVPYADVVSHIVQAWR